VLPVAALSTALATQAASLAAPGASTITAVACAQTISHLPIAGLVEAGMKALTMKTTKILINMSVASILLAASVGLVAQRIAQPEPAVGSFTPFQGQWAGTMESSGDALPAATSQPVEMTITPTDQGNSCQIELRVIYLPQRQTNIFRFSHALSAGGTKITTKDDPQVGRLNGIGEVMEVGQKGTNVSEFTFKTPHVNQTGMSECRWSLTGTNLTIIRQDKMQSPQGSSTLISKLQVHRQPEAK
jgi:hypothetical protein